MTFFYSYSVFKILITMISSSSSSSSGRGGRGGSSCNNVVDVILSSSLVVVLFYSIPSFLYNITSALAIALITIISTC